MERAQGQSRGQIQRMHLKRTHDGLLPYTYDVLESRDKIRTLKLHSSKDRIECSLRQTNYSEGDYQALSYCWGSEEKPFKAVVLDEDGDELGYLHLTTNLYHALCDLRDSEEVKNKLFWIDQICINQEEVDEKNHQVELMGKIYQNASRVITYLGPAATDEEEKRGMALLQLLHSHFASNYPLIYKSGSIFRARLKFSEFPVLKMPEELRVVDNNHENFVNRYVGQGWKWLLQAAFGKWTGRLWIVQEQLLNKEVVMLRGLRELPWDAVAGIPLLYVMNLLPQEYVSIFWEEEWPNSKLVPSHVADTVYSLWWDRQRQKEWQEIGASTFLSPLSDNMLLYEDLECGDPRDRIFALLAISSDSVELGITPDYSKSTPISRIFLGASVSILKRARNLTPLVCACNWANTWKSPGSSFEESDPDITSKHPSWAYCPPGRTIPITLSFGNSNPHPTSLLLSRPRFSLNESVLILKGHAIDRISKSTSFDFMGVSYFLNTYDKLCILDWSRILLILRAFLLGQGVTVLNTAALCRALVGEANWSPNSQEGLTSAENEASYFMSFYRSNLSIIRKESLDIGVDVTSTLEQCDSFVQILAALLYDKPKLEYFRPDCSLEPEEVEAAHTIERYFGMQGRSICVTEEGRTCNAMHQPSQGDVVAAFQGADRLFILRPVENRYKLIGEAYVDGLMKGEAYEGCNPEELDEDIELV